LKVLIVNKFLYPNGGSETYIFRLGEELQRQGHEVQFFGMEHEGRIVGNHAEAYTSDIDFHTGKIKKLLYPFKIIYSLEARGKIRKVLLDFRPDVVHLNNFNFQLTPSIIYEINKFGRKSGKKIKIVFTAHDYQIICPNHMMRIPSTGENCEKCLGGSFINCTKNKCIHNSGMKSLLGSLEGYIYSILKTYRFLDTIICPTHFIEAKIKSNPLFCGRTVVMHNFIDVKADEKYEKRDYVIYFGRYSDEKGMHTLLQACGQLPDISFVFAGVGPLEKELQSVKNIKNVGFQSGGELVKYIKEAKFSVYPSEWYENCPFSVMESQAYGTPIIGADIGGIPELIQAGVTGELFKSGDVKELCLKIRELWENNDKLSKYTENCSSLLFNTTEQYCKQILKIYAE
jgi:glycosyltransferase involved in cell wall biosynthesis